MTGSEMPAASRPVRWTALGQVYVAPPQGPSHRAFGFTVGGVLVAIGAFSAWRGHVTRAEIAGAIGLVLIVAAAVRPAALGGLSTVWSHLGHALGWFNSRVLLTLTYALVFCPIALVGRLLGNDALSQRPNAGSLWVEYPPRLRDRKHFERLF